MTRLSKHEEAVLIHHPRCLQCPCQHVLWCAGDMPQSILGFNYLQDKHASAYAVDFMLKNGNVRRIFIPLSCPRVDKRGGEVFR